MKQMVDFRHKRVIIQGYPLDTHTHSYGHHGLYRGFRKLGIEAYWVDVSNGWSIDTSVKSLDFDDALILGEGHGSMNLVPKVKSSTYMIHNLGNKPDGPMSYCGPHLYSNVARLIDWRCNPMYKWSDVCYDFTMSAETMEQVGPGCRLEKGSDYDKVYLSWATNLLPEEFNLDDRFMKREKVSWYIGTIGGGMGGLDDSNDTKPEHDNRPALREWKRACDDAGVEFKSNCPWIKPLSYEEARVKIQSSWVTADFRHPCGLEWGFVPCRMFKNMSYGQLGVTNSKGIYEFFNGNVIFNEDPYQLFFDAQNKMNDMDVILSQMKMVQENHTYINRCKSILEIVNNS